MRHAVLRRLLVFGAALAAMVALGGCKLDVGVEVQVEPDGTGTIHISAVADADVVNRAPKLADDLDFSDAVAAGWVVDGPSTRSGGGMRVALSHDFATVEEATALLASINGPNGPLHDIVLARTSASDEITFQLTGALHVDGGLDAFADPALLASLGATPFSQQIADAKLTPDEALDLEFKVRLPGSINSATKPDGGTLTWKIPLDGQPTTVEATSRSSRGNPGGGGLWRFVASAALILAVAWVLAMLALTFLVRRAQQQRAARRPVRSTSRPAARPQTTVAHPSRRVEP